VQFSVVPSAKLQVAISCSVVPLAIDGSGVIVIELKVAEVTMTVVEPWMPLRLAVIGVFPAVTPDKSPWVGDASLTCAIALLPEDQLT
jgi:hypothetical protein